MERRIVYSCCLLLLAVGVSYGQSGDQPQSLPVPGAVTQPEAQQSNSTTGEPGSSVPDPPRYDPTSRRFDSGASEEQVAAESPKPLPVFSLLPDFKVLLGGTVTADFVYASQRTVAPGTPFLLTPASPTGASTQTFNAIARQSTLFALFQGPEICGFESGGLVAANFYNTNLVSDLYGLLPIEAFGHLRNDDWRFAAGLQLDIFNPRMPTVLPFSILLGSGNTGAYRGQARVERYFYPSEESQVTLLLNSRARFCDSTADRRQAASG